MNVYRTFGQFKCFLVSDGMPPPVLMRGEVFTQSPPEMEEAGFRVLSQSGIADGYSGADRLLVAEIYRAMFAFDLRTSGTQHLTEETNKSR